MSITQVMLTALPIMLAGMLYVYAAAHAMRWVVDRWDPPALVLLTGLTVFIWTAAYAVLVTLAVTGFLCGVDP